MALQRIGLRLIIGIIVAVVGVVVYFKNVEVNPITGAKQHVSLSPDEEIRLGLRAAPHMAHEMGGELDATDPRRHVVERLGSHLLNASIVNKGPWKFQFHVLSDDKSINAFALPGGQIFITLGLLKKLSTEAELASVLGHEIGHVIERHTAEQMAKHELGQTMVVAVGTAASESGRSGYAIAALVNHMIQLRYGRKDELESDRWGLLLMADAAYHPRAMIRVMEVLKAASHDRGGLDIFQTHPNPDQRIKDINEHIQKNSPSTNFDNGHLLKELFANPALVGQKNRAAQ